MATVSSARSGCVTEPMNGLSLYLIWLYTHVEVTLVDRQIDRLTDRAAGVVQSRAHTGQLHEVAKVLDRRVAATPLKIAHERRSIGGNQHGARSADDGGAPGVAGVLRVLARRRGPGPATGTGRAGNRTRSPLTSAPASFHSFSARGKSRNSMPISSSTVSALCSISSSASVSRTSKRGILRSIQLASSPAALLRRSASFAARPARRFRAGFRLSFGWLFTHGSPPNGVRQASWNSGHDWIPKGSRWSV